MPILDRIESTVQRILSDSQSLRLVPRGAPRYLDRDLRGTLRFARRRGSFLPTWAAETSTQLAEPATTGALDLKVQRMLGTFGLGSIVQLAGRSRHYIQDTLLDEARLLLADNLLDAYAVGKPVASYAQPITSVGPFRAGSTTLQVRAPFEIHNGDELHLMLDPSLILSAARYQVLAARPLGRDGTQYTTEVDLDDDTARALATDETLYCRTRPAYHSTRVQLPVMDAASVRPIGPFLIDYLSGAFTAQLGITETLSLQLYGQSGVIGGYEYPVTVQKNTPIVNLPIPSDALLFWHRVNGTLDWNGRRTLCRHDQNGHFRLIQPLVPTWPVGNSWEIRVLCSSSALIRVGFPPAGFREYSIGAGERTTITIGTDAGDPAGERIEIISRSAADAVLEWGDFRPVGQSVRALEYRIVSSAEATHDWQASSALAKPIFFTRDDVTPRSTEDRLSGGLLLF